MRDFQVILLRAHGRVSLSCSLASCRPRSSSCDEQQLQELLPSKGHRWRQGMLCRQMSISYWFPLPLLFICLFVSLKANCSPRAWWPLRFQHGPFSWASSSSKCLEMEKVYESMTFILLTIYLVAVSLHFSLTLECHWAKVVGCWCPKLLISVEHLL